MINKLEKKPIKFRHEYKHMINEFDDREVSFNLRKLFEHDENAGPHGDYRVVSLYFDTPYDKALRQKIDGVDCREKFRIRYYNADTVFFKLEKKIKVAGLCGKRTAKLTREQVEKILAGDVDFLAASAEPLMVEFYSKIRGQQLQLKTVVCYDREAFRYEPGNVRVTIDRHLRTGTNPMDFLEPTKSLMDVSGNISVLEVKYDEFLPEIVKCATQLRNRQASPFSKYAVCRQYD